VGYIFIVISANSTNVT